MSEQESEENKASWSLSEIVTILFKHKWKILLCGLLGIAAAAVTFLVAQPFYYSEAKLFVPYVVDRNLVDATGETTITSRANDAIINSEVAILKSWDLIFQTARALVPEDAADRDAASLDLARGMADNMWVTTEKGMNVITVGYRDRDPDFASKCLQELLKYYREKHIDVHRFSQSVDVITQRRDDVLKQLDKTEAELKELREQVQSVSLVESTRTLNAAVAGGQDALNRAIAERRGQQARVDALAQWMTSSAETGEHSTQAAVDDSKTEEYRSLSELLGDLRAKERSLLATYPPESRIVKISRRQISDLEERQKALESRYPGIAGVSAVKNDSDPRSSLLGEKVRLEGMKASEEVLQAQLQELEAKRDRLANVAPQIARLELEKEVLEANYRNIESSLGKAKDDRAVDWSKISNIASVQEPSPATWMQNPLRKRVVPALAAAGLVIGVGFALLKEKMLDRTVKSVSELEGRLHIPVLLSIPFIRISRRLGRNPLLLENSSKDGSEANGTPDTAPWAMEHFIRPFCDAIRDRVLLSFELRKVSHKPKLIGVSGFSKGAGTSTLAGGLAAALSGTGDGKVLLVDMNSRDGEVHPFFEGKAAPSLASLLTPAGTAPSAAAENLYLATIDGAHRKQIPLGLKRFHSLMPSLKAADFEYVVFDMPPLEATSPTLGMACFMDKVLVVLEAERSDEDHVKRAYADLMSLRANVSCVFNKARCYTPSWLGGPALETEVEVHEQPAGVN